MLLHEHCMILYGFNFIVGPGKGYQENLILSCTTVPTLEWRMSCAPPATPLLLTSSEHFAASTRLYALLYTLPLLLFLLFFLFFFSSNYLFFSFL